jgi:hypothetical protein
LRAFLSAAISLEQRDCFGKKRLAMTHILTRNEHTLSSVFRKISDPAHKSFGCSFFQRETRMKSILFLLLFLLPHSPQSHQQNQENQKERKFTIENCVNEFSLANAESTKVGYQYWFVDKDFLDGRTLKMSVVKPHEATHPPHRHPNETLRVLLEKLGFRYTHDEYYPPTGLRHPSYLLKAEENANL